jgi:hypothetical protein
MRYAKYGKSERLRFRAGQKLPVPTTEGDLSGNPPGGYLADGATPGPVLSNALNFVVQSLGGMVTALNARGLLDHTGIIVSAKHGQSPNEPGGSEPDQGRANHRWPSARHGIMTTRAGILGQFS